MSVPISADPQISGVVLAEQASTPTSPAAGKRKLYVGTDGVLKVVDSAGASTAVGPGAFVPTSIADAKGDLIAALDADVLVRLAVGANGTVLTADAAAATGVKWAAPGATARAAAIAFTFGDGLNAVVAATEPDQWLEIPFACTITAWRLLADAAGSVVVDLWKDTYAAAPPTAADTITAAAKPTLSAAIKAESTALTGWTTTLAAGDWLRAHVESAATLKRVVLSLRVAA